MFQWIIREGGSTPDISIIQCYAPIVIASEKLDKLFYHIIDDALKMSHKNVIVVGEQNKQKT